MSGPLYDLEIERRLLGGLLDGGDVNAATDLIQATDLYHRQYQLVFSAATEVFRKGSAVSPATVAAELRRAGHNDISIATLEELQKEGELNFAVAEIATYAETIHNLARRREVEHTGTGIARLARDSNLSVTDLLERATTGHGFSGPYANVRDRRHGRSRAQRVGMH